MRSTVLVINPCIADFKLYDEWMHPTGLYFLIDLLEQNNINTFYFNFLDPSIHTHEKKFGTGTFPYQEIPKPALYNGIKRKYKLYGSPSSSFKKYLEQIPSPDLICIGSSMTYWVLGVIKTVSIIRSFFPKTPIVCGGIAAQLIPEYLKTNLPDCFITKDLIHATQPHSGIPVLAGLKCNIEQLSMKGGIDKINNSPHGPILLSLGCPMNCSYCASSVLQPTYHIRNINHVVEEIERLYYACKVTDFAFYDDALLINKESGLYLLLNRLKEKNIKIRLHTPNGLHLRYIDQRILENMKEAGFATLRFGYESSNARYRKATSGKINHKEIEQRIAAILKIGFDGKQIGIYVMGGLPMQSPEDMISELNYVNSLGVLVKPVFISPVPGSMLFDEYAQTFPHIKINPLWHNDTFFITNLENWDDNTLEIIRQRARVLNSTLNSNQV